MVGVGHRHRGPGGPALHDTLQLCGARLSLVDLDLWTDASCIPPKGGGDQLFFLFDFSFSILPRVRHTEGAYLSIVDQFPHFRSDQVVRGKRKVG